MKSTTHPDPLCPAIEADYDVGLLRDWLTYHLWWSPPPLYNLWQIPFLCCEFILVLLLKSQLFQITCLLAYQFRPLFALHGLMHMRNSPEPYIWLILALQDVKGSIQYSMHAVELHSCLCLWFTTSGCPLLVRSLARLYNPWMTLPTLQHPGYVHSMREQSSQTHRLPTTQVRTQKHLNCVIASQKCREKTKSKNM